MISSKTVRIGCHAGFWGDSFYNLGQILDNSDVDYLVSDYLAETTMSIMSAIKLKNPDAGYAPDFVTSLAPRLKEIQQRGIKVITNAGGINPRACRDALVKASAESGVDLNVAVVLGDDLTDRESEIRALGPTDLESRRSLPEKITSMNAYLGAPPVAAALAQGADVVICGRVTDSAVVIGALMHEFGWGQGGYDQLAAAALAGHIVECVQQATGGSFTDWRDVPGWENVGLPIVEFSEDCSFVVTKPDNTGGLVSIGTVSEQIMYEMGDPAGYVLPEVVCDFRNIELTQIDRDRVRVSGARGQPPTPSYKVSATYLDGYKLIGTMMLGGRDAEAKARRQGHAIVKRIGGFIEAAGLGPFEETSVELVGAEDGYGMHRRTGPARDVILKIGVHHKEKRALEIFSTEFVASVLAMGQGSTGFFAGRPRPSPFIRHFSFLLDKSEVPVSIEINGERQAVEIDAGEALAPDRSSSHAWPTVDLSGQTASVPLVALAWGRSGDKGNSANLGIIAREPEYASVIAQELTEEVVLGFFAHFGADSVKRYEMPGILGFNFIVSNVLGGGGASSLRYDSQGKTYAQMLMDLPLRVPAEWGDGKPRIRQFMHSL